MSGLGRNIVGGGEWLLSSYLATGMANVPIFIEANDAEDEVEK